MPRRSPVKIGPPVCSTPLSPHPSTSDHDHATSSSQQRYHNENLTIPAQATHFHILSSPKKLYCQPICATTPPNINFIFPSTDENENPRPQLSRWLYIYQNERTPRYQRVTPAERLIPPSNQDFCHLRCRDCDSDSSTSPEPPKTSPLAANTT